MDCDVAVVGAGILGLATARELLARRPGLRVTLLEREPEVGFHQTGHNSGVIHAGIYYAPGSLKARLCVSGARELYGYCEARGVEARRCGKLIVATRKEEEAGLDELERRGRANGVPGLRRLGPAEIRELEPHATGVAALHSPSTGVVDFRAVARALSEDLERAGGELLLGSEVTGIAAGGRSARLTHSRGQTEAGAAVFCAGMWSDRLARTAGAPADPRVVPFRGAYLRLRPERRSLVRTLIYPVPDPSLPFLGVHLSRQVDGEVTIGPTALLAAAREPGRRASVPDLASTLGWPGTWRMARRFWRTGLAEIRRSLSVQALVSEARRYVPELEAADVLPGYTGLRAQALSRDGRLIDDFVFSVAGRALHVRNAPSPAATACLAIAREVVDRLEETHILPSR